VISSAAEALGIAVAARVPVLLWGAPGTGKTSAIRAMAEAMGLPCETVIASIREPSDFAGLPVVIGNTGFGVDSVSGAAGVAGGDAAAGVAGGGDAAGGAGGTSASGGAGGTGASGGAGVGGGGGGAGGAASVRFAPPAWAIRLARAGTGLLFLDELSTAPPAVQAALLRVVLERTVGDLDLPADVAVVAAANPPEQAADGWDLSAPLANRLCHLHWEATPQSIADGLAGGWPTPSVPLLPDEWEAGEVATKALIAAFLRVRPALAIAPPANAADAGKAWPSPRTWEMAARLRTAASAAEATGEAHSALVRGAVGDGAGTEFLAWLTEMDLPDPEEVLADPAKFQLPERGDRAYAALASIAAAVAARPTPDRWTAAWRVLGMCAQSAPDVAASAAMTLARCRPPGMVEMPPEIRLFAQLVRDAGLTT
jgi:MoxR-like ATPase